MPCRLLSAKGLAANIRVGDFLDVELTDSYDVCIGNPPGTVRFHGHTGEARDRSQRVAAASDVVLSDLASSWAGFVIRATQLLKPEGRLGLVLPAELMTVNYADPVRQILQSYARVRLVVFQERVFPEVTEEVVLLLAEGRGDGPAPGLELHEARNVEELRPASELNGRSRRRRPTPAGATH